MTRSRQVYYLTGYDPARAETLHRRFAGELETFKRTWNVEATLSPPEQIDTRPSVSWVTTVHAPDWQAETVHELLLWGDFVREDLKRPLTRRLIDAASAYLDFIATGTAVRFAAASWRYVLFFLYPLIVSALFAGSAWMFGRVLSDALSSVGLNRVLVGSLAGVVLFVVLMWAFGAQLRLPLLLDLWSFADDYIYRRRPGLEARLDQFAKLVVEGARSGTADEIVIVGHSLGSAFAIDLLERALGYDPDLAHHGPSIGLLTLGASIPKFTLHKNAGRLRAAAARVAAEPAIAWTEIQSRDDLVSFYKFDPVSLQRLAGDRMNAKPVVRRVQIHDMLQPATFWRKRLNVMRFHYQCVMANDKPAPYDYFLATCGPVPFARWSTSPRGLLDFVAADVQRARQSTGQMTMAWLSDRLSV
jgi:hypothetical protein